MVIRIIAILPSFRFLIALSEALGIFQEGINKSVWTHYLCSFVCFSFHHTRWEFRIFHFPTNKKEKKPDISQLLRYQYMNAVWSSLSRPQWWWYTWAQLLSHVWLFAARQAPLSMGFSRQEHWSGLPFPFPGDLPKPGIKPKSPVAPELTGRFLTTEPLGKPKDDGKFIYKQSWSLWIFRYLRRIFSNSRIAPISPESGELETREKWFFFRVTLFLVCPVSQKCVTQPAFIMAYGRCCPASWNRAGPRSKEAVQIPAPETWHSPSSSATLPWALGLLKLWFSSGWWLSAQGLPCIWTSPSLGLTDRPEPEAAVVSPKTATTNCQAHPTYPPLPTPPLRALHPTLGCQRRENGREAAAFHETSLGFMTSFAFYSMSVKDISTS